MRDLSPFHSEVIDFLQKEIKKQCEENGVDSETDPEFQKFIKSAETLPLTEIIDNYQHLFGSHGPIHIEKILMEAFPIQEFIELGLARYYPRMYRGLPRIYHRSSPTQSHIKRNFTHLPSLKKQAITRALFSLYAHCPAKGKMAVFTWVMTDGFGDCTAATETVRILKGRFPDLEVNLVAVVPSAWASRVQGKFIIPYEKEVPSLPKEAVEFLQSMDFVLQIPTFYPHTAELGIKQMERIGEYGFVESSWFHPRSNGYSMGLHFLEKGIFIRKLKQAEWKEVKNEGVLRWRRAENHFYFAYLASPIGGAVYLHALLKSLEGDEKSIDICVPDLGWFIQYVERQKLTGKPILEWEMGVATLEVVFEDKLYSLPLAPQGKQVRLICPGPLEQSDFQLLLYLSGDFVAVRGDQSFTDAVCSGKPFFYDGRQHARYFLKDLVALAENRIGSYRSALECIRGMQEAFFYNLPLTEEEWVEETFFQEIEEWTAIALKIGLALQDPEIGRGFQNLSQIIAAEYSANHFICHLVQRALCHLHHPEIEDLESEEISRFTSRLQTFSQTVQTIGRKLEGIR